MLPWFLLFMNVEFIVSVVAVHVTIVTMDVCHFGRFLNEVGRNCTGSLIEEGNKKVASKIKTEFVQVSMEIRGD